MKRLVSMLTLLSVFAAAPTRAEDVLHCHSCTDQMMKSKAISKVPDGGKVHVVDLDNTTVRAYQVFRENDMVIVQKSPVKSSIEEAVSEFKNTINLFDDIAERGIDFNHLKPFLGDYSSLIHNAYDVARTSRYRLEVTKAIGKYVGASTAGRLSTAVGALGLGFINATAAVHISFQVKFPDGSTYNYYFKGVEYQAEDMTPILIVVPVNESGRDGNIVIPDSGKFGGYAQSASSMESLSELLEYMRQSGVKITSSASGGGQPVVIICDDFKNCTSMVK